MKKTLLKIAISAFLFFLLSRLVDLSQFKEDISGANFLFLALSCLVIVISFIAGAFRWRALIGDDSQL